MNRRTFEKVLFVTSFAGGIGCLIGGTWIPPLFAVGGILLAGSLGLWQGTLAQPGTPQTPQAQNQPEIPSTPPNTPEPPKHVSHTLTWQYSHHREDSGYTQSMYSESHTQDNVKSRTLDMVEDTATGDCIIAAVSNKLTHA